MKYTLLPCFWGILLLAGTTTVHRHVFSASEELEEPHAVQAAESAEASQRVVFLLQYLATDYDRAVQNGQIADSLEYDEMQRFAKEAIKIYQSTTAIQRQTLTKLQKLEGLIAARAALPEIRKLCDETIAILVKEKNLSVGPQRTLSLDYGKSLFQENCTPCHGLRGAGDGASADTLNPKPRDFTAPERMNVYTPWQFYQAITFGVEGTAMPSFSEALDPRARWNLAFYLMTLRRDFQPVAPATPQKFTLQELATKSNAELIAFLLPRNGLLRADSLSDLKHAVDYYRQNPPELTMDDYMTIAETGLKRSLIAYQRADSAHAAQLAQGAYWDGFEFLEGDLPSQIYIAFERAYTEYQSCLEAKAPPEKARASIKKMLKILQQIRDQKGLR
jgi:high-affinity iron transporter